MSTELIKFSELSNAPDILEKNRGAVERAKQAGFELLEKIQNAGMTEALDNECNEILVKLRKQIEVLNERRKPLTQLLDAIKKEFTRLETELKSDVYDKIQEYRNQYAKQKLEEQRKKEEEAALRKAKMDEMAIVKQQVEVALSEHVNNYFDSEFKRLQAHFDAINLDNWTEKEGVIGKASILYPEKHYNEFTMTLITKYVSPDDKKAIKQAVMTENIQKYAAMFQSEMADFKKSLLDKINSKVGELRRIANAEKENAELANKLKAAAEERAKAEAEKLKKDAEQRQAKAEAEAKSKAEAQKMQNLFDATAETIDPNTKTQERTGYNMIVSHPSGYLQIFAFWFEHEGKDMPMDAIEKRSIGQMKAFCEKYAHKNESFIESKFIKYDEIVKVRAKTTV